MKKTNLIPKLSMACSRAKLKVKIHSPEILIVAGVVGVIGSTVMACRATTKVGTILANTKEQIDAVHTVLENDEISEETYSAEDSKKDLFIIYAHAGVDFVKLYAPAVILGGLSITAIISSNNILRKRNIAAVAAYTSLNKKFSAYSGRVRDRFGEEVEKEIRYGVKAEEIDVTAVDEDGNEKVEKKTVKVVENYGDHDVFDETNPNWNPVYEYSLMFLKSQESYFNDLLKSRKTEKSPGYVFLNEVRKDLGLPIIPAGQYIGWTYDPDYPNGDNYIDFGIAKFNKSADKIDPIIVLDFNVDGNIIDLI